MCTPPHTFFLLTLNQPSRVSSALPQRGNLTACLTRDVGIVALVPTPVAIRHLVPRSPLILSVDLTGSLLRDPDLFLYSLLTAVFTVNATWCGTEVDAGCIYYE